MFGPFVLSLVLAVQVPPAAAAPAAIPADRGEGDLVPIFLDPPASIEAFWERLNRPDYVLMKGDRYRSLLRPTDAGPSPPRTEDGVTRVLIRGEVGSREATLEAELSYLAKSPGSIWVPIRLDGLVITRAAEGETLLPIRATTAGVWEVEVIGKGVHTLRISTTVRVLTNGEERRLDLPIPLAGSTSLDLWLAEGPTDASLGVTDPVLPVKVAGRAGTHLEAHIRPRSKVELSWRAPVDQSTVLAPLLSAQGDVAVDVGPDSIRTRSRWVITAARGISRSLTFSFDASEELLEVDLDGRSLPVEGVVQDQVATVTIPLTDPLRQLGPARTVSLTTRRRIAVPSADILVVKGASPANAMIQGGALAVTRAGPVWVDGKTGRGLQRIDPANELPAELRIRPGTILAYRIVDRPFELHLNVAPSPPQVEVRSRTTMILRPGEASTETRLDFRATPRRVFEIGFRVPPDLALEPVVTDDVVESAHLADEPAEGGEGERSRRLVVQLTAKARDAGTFVIKLNTRQRLERVPTSNLALIDPLDATIMGGRIAVLRSLGVEASLDPPPSGESRFRRDPSPSLADWTWPTDRPQGTDNAPLWFRYDGAPDVLPLRVSSLRPTYAAETDVIARVGRSGIDYRQSVQLSVTNGLADEVEVVVPAEVDRRWEVEGAEVKPRDPVGVGEDGSRRYRLVPSRGPTRLVDLKFRYWTTFAPALDIEGRRDGRFALLRILPESTGSIRLGYAAEPGVVLKVDEGGWGRRDTSAIRTLDPSASLELARTDLSAPLPTFSASAARTVSLPGLLISRAFLRTVRGGEELRTTATFRLETHGDEAVVSLPAGSRWLGARLEGSPIADVEVVEETSSYRIRLPRTGESKPAVVAVDYACPVAGKGGLEPPVFEGAVALSTYWEFTVAGSHAVLGTPSRWSDENQWYWGSYVWMRKPWISGGELLEWVSGPSPRATGGIDELVGSRTNVHGYLFRRTDGAAPLEVTVVSRAVLTGLSSGLIAVVGIALVLIRPSARPIAVATAAVVAVGLAAAAPNITLQVAQSGAIGIVLAAIAAALQWYIDRRRRASRRFGEAASVSPSPSSASLLSVGSDESTAIRARPATTAERIILTPARSQGPTLSETGTAE